MKFLQAILVIGGAAGLVGIRVLENTLFYDPFLHYFQEASKKALFPEFDFLKLIFSHIFRFLLNLLFSLMMVQGLFNRKKWTVQAAVLITVVFMITFPVYLICVANRFEVGYLFSFYVRRFVIQPLIVLLIIPLFYYRKFLLENRK